MPTLLKSLAVFIGLSGNHIIDSSFLQQEKRVKKRGNDEGHRKTVVQGRGKE